MTARPPENLPARSRDLWRALRDADRRATSRAALCRRLGVSTHTVQRILVDGDVPDFSRPQSTRLVRSWIRAVTRLAWGLDREPRRWIEGLGIRWDDDARRVSEEAARRLRWGPRPAKGSGEPVRVGSVDLRPFADPLPGGRSFFEETACRLVGAVSPDRDVEVRLGTASEEVRALTDDPSGPSLVLGVFDSAHLRGRGVEILPLPGWRLGFGAVALGPAPARWEDVAGPAGRVLVVVQPGDPGWPLARSAWGVAPERIVVRSRATPEALAADLRELATEREEAVALVADEETCRRAAEELGRRGTRSRLHVSVLAPPDEERPRFQLGIAVRADAGRRLALLEHAWREELFGAARAATARLYADLLATASRSFGTEGDPSRLPTNARPDHFPQADARFRRILARRLVAALRESGPPVERDEDWDLLVRRARALVPREWRTTVDETAWAAKLAASAASAPAPRPFDTYCRSCSGSLREYPSPSPHYCRFCTDEGGRLLPRDEVHRLIAHWMTLWQEGISEKEAGARASRYMSAMPAWS